MPLSGDARRQYAREYVAKRKAKWFEDKSCVDCGSTEEMQIDHVDPKLKISHKVWTWSEKRRNAELAKCVVRCKPCHLFKSRKNRELNGSAKITFEIAEKIRAEYKEGTKQSVLANKYGLNFRTIYKICTNQIWSPVV